MAESGSSEAQRRDSVSSSSTDRTPEPVDLAPDTEWQDVSADEEDLTFVSLVDDQTFSKLPEMLQHCKTKANLDIAAAVQKYNLEFYDGIKLVNFIRERVKSSGSTPDILSAPSKESVPWSDDKYMQPVLEDDAVLFSIDDLTELAHGARSVETNTSDSLQTKYDDLSAKFQSLMSDFEQYRLAVSEAMEKRWNERESVAPASAPVGAQSRRQIEDEQGYFDSYAYNDIHETMLKDSVRTGTYRDFIYGSKARFNGATVLDVGCGTGILSMFSAKAGATQVFAVDNSNIIDRARENVYTNGLADQISCVRGKIEEVSLPFKPTHAQTQREKPVDIIISEWMGYALLYEAMLPSVLHARDMYLNPQTGIMAPSHVTLRMAPLSRPDYVADVVGFWHDVYGFDMTPMTTKICDAARVEALDSADVAGDSVEVKRFDLYTVTAPELDFSAPFSLTLDKDIDLLDGFVVWFDTFFLPDRTSTLPPDARAEQWKSGTPTFDERRGYGFTTGPHDTLATHWQQAVLLIDRTKLKKEDLGGLKLAKGAKVEGTLTYSKGKENERELDIQLEWSVPGHGKEKGKQMWMMR